MPTTSRRSERRAAAGRVPAGERGLTLIEMIVVLAIIALVTALLVPNVMGRWDQARVTSAETDLHTIGGALKMYRLDNGDYPTTEQGLAALVTRPVSGGATASASSAGGYLDKLPTDPWGHAYVYKSPGDAGEGYALASLGKDGKPGGEGLAADLKVSGN